MRVALTLAIFVLALSAAAQTIPPKPRQNMLNEPFSADAVTTIVRTLADGTHITRQTARRSAMPKGGAATSGAGRVRESAAGAGRAAAPAARAREGSTAD